jgi:tetratricopeptide (TPR) repeat protein
MCRNCFEQSINIKRDKYNLRGMAMVTRQLIQNKSDNIKQLLDDSISYAKEALNLDIKDKMSWYILGNCYNAKFFSPFGQPNILKQALSAYNLALKDSENESEVSTFQVDLYVNKSMVCMYEEDWQSVLTCLSKALELDPHMSDVTENLRGILEYLTNLTNLVSTKGKLKPKKFQTLIGSIKKSDEIYHWGNETTSNLSNSYLNDLKSGLNDQKFIIGKVICGMPMKSIENFDILSFTCCIADRNGDCCVLSIFNLAKGQGLAVNDTVLIPEPWFESYDINYDPNDTLITQFNLNNHYNFKFPSIRIENPAVLTVNGKKWSKDKISSMYFVPKVIDD